MRYLLIILSLFLFSCGNEKSKSYNGWTYEFENNLINEWTQESYQEAQSMQRGVITYEEMRNYIECIVKKAKVYYSASEMTALMIKQGPEFNKLLNQCLYIFD